MKHDEYIWQSPHGRIARVLGDLLLTRADGSSQRFYSLSAQIQRERKAYYDILERIQKGSMECDCVVGMV